MPTKLQRSLILILFFISLVFFTTSHARSKVRPYTLVINITGAKTAQVREPLRRHRRSQQMTTRTRVGYLFPVICINKSCLSDLIVRHGMPTANKKPAKKCKTPVYYKGEKTFIELPRSNDIHRLCPKVAKRFKKEGQGPSRAITTFTFKNLTQRYISVGFAHDRNMNLTMNHWCTYWTTSIPLDGFGFTNNKGGNFNIASNRGFPKNWSQTAFDTNKKRRKNRVVLNLKAQYVADYYCGSNKYFEGTHIKEKVIDYIDYLPELRESTGVLLK